MKNFLRVVALIALMGIILSVPAFAAQPRWSNVASMTLRILKNNNQYICDIEGFSGTTQIECTMVLYEKNQRNQYVEISRVTLTHNGRDKQFVGNCSMQANKTYMLTVNAVVTCNGTKETITDSIVR